MDSIKNKSQVVVCSRSFSKNPVLRAELLSRYAQVKFNDDGLQLEGRDLIAFVGDSEKVIVGLETINGDILDSLPGLKVVSKYGVGLDKIDMDAMRKYGKALGWTGGVNCRSVSELVVSSAIAMLRHIPLAHREVLQGTWRQHVGGQLSGRTVGIIGCGHVGKDLVTLLKAFGCKIIVNDIIAFPDFYAEHNIEAVGLETLLASSDVVTLHVPFDGSTEGMLNKRRLGLMKPSAILINAARGGLVDEVEVKEMLKSGRLAAAAFDVFESEPPTDHELLNLPNFLVTPHLGGSAEEAILAMGRAAIDGLDQHAIP